MSSGTHDIELATERENVIAMRLEEGFDAADMAHFNERLNAIQAAGQKARVYLEIPHIPSLDLGTLREKTSNMGNIWSGIERVAYVVDKSWMANLVGLIDAVTPMQFRAFTSAETEQARTWLLSTDEDQTMSSPSTLARRVLLEDAWNDTGHSPVCCLVYATQNGWKLPILFEEMGVAYDWALVDFDKNEQRAAHFLAINPNGRIPALIDRARGVTVAESGAILEYAATRFSSSLLPSPQEDLPLHLQVKQWLYWQVSGLGPAMGQAMYFQRIAKVRGHEDAFAIGRFVAEAERCLRMLDDQLRASGGPFVLGESCTLVDVACFAYAASAYWANVDVSDMTHLRGWIDMLHERPSFRTGLTIPFARPAFFGPPHASEAEIEAEIARNAGQFQVVTKPPG